MPPYTFESTASSAVERDRWGRPLIIPPEGGKPRPYTRVTTFVDCLDDRFALEKWKLRQVAAGLANRPDLVLAAGAHRDDKSKLDALCSEAMDAAGARRASTTGTALHTFTEHNDRGQLYSDAVPAEARADIEAYRSATTRMNHIHIEQLMVNDELGTAGTPDRISDLLDFEGLHIGDVKSGDITYSLGKIAMQLAVYARSHLYDPATGRRTPIAGLRQDFALVIHLPAGQGRCDLYWVDIAAGWEGVLLARQVRAWRRRKINLTEVIDGPRLAELARTQVHAGSTWSERIAAAVTVIELENIWSHATAAGEWTSALTTAAAARKKELMGAVT